MLGKSKKEKKKKEEESIINDDLNVDDGLEMTTEETIESDGMNQNKVAIMLKILKNVKEEVGKLINFMENDDVSEEDLVTSAEEIKTGVMELESKAIGQERIVEGVFDGANMIGPDGKQYSVPANYASKSKLVEGDILKLTITPQGTFIFKQIGPIERSRLIGTLALDKGTESFYVEVDSKKYKVLTASITYYKGDVGDEVVILVPKNSDTKWAAVENVIKKPS